MKYLIAPLISLLICLQVIPAWAAITYVGALSGQTFGTTTALTVTLTLTGGSDSVPAVGDLVVVTWCTGSTVDRTLVVQNTSSVAYTLIGSEQYGNDDNDTSMRVSYRVMPDPAETQVRLSETPTGGTGSAADGGTYHIAVFRGVHATPLEQAAQQGTGINTMLVNPGDITPTTPGTVVYVSGCGGLATGGLYTSSDLTDFRAETAVDAIDSNIGGGYFVWSSGTFSPATFGGGGTDATAHSYAWTIAAFAPAAEGVTCRGALMLMGVGGC